MKNQIEKFLNDINLELVPFEKLRHVDRLQAILRGESGWDEAVQAEAQIAMGDLGEAIVNRKHDLRSPRNPAFDGSGWRKLEDYAHKGWDAATVRILSKNGRYKVSIFTSKTQHRRFFCNTLEAARNVAAQFADITKGDS